MIPNTSLPKTPAVAVYKAILNQTGTAAPVATVLQNTTGIDWDWTRESAGQYRLTPDELADKYSLFKIMITVPNNSTPTTLIMGRVVEILTSDTLDYILLTTKTYSDVYTDTLLLWNTFQLEIYK